MLTGENGIITQAQRAKNETENAAKQEEEDLAELEAAITGKDVPIVQVDDKNPGQLEQENDTTFVINSIEDLVFFSYDITNGNTYEGKTVKLGVNLDFNSDKSYVNPNRTDFAEYGYNGPLKQALTSGTGFNPIGSQDRTNSFYGTFDGDNNAICSLYINMNSDENLVAGLFGACYGEIKNIGLVNADITVQGKSNVIAGGLVGVCYNGIYNSYATGNINATANGYISVGGIGGATKGNANIKNCYNLVNLECTNSSEPPYTGSVACGGILGQSSVENANSNEEVNIEKCFNLGNVNADAGDTLVVAGGIIGAKSDTSLNLNIKNCYNNAKIQGSGSGEWLDKVGGIVGYLNSATLSNCYNTGDVIGIQNGNVTGDIVLIGGIIGDQENNTTINNVFNVGKVASKSNSDNSSFSIGGIVGISYGSTNINNAYNIGTVTTNDLSNKKAGSISGSDLITFNNCYYLKGTYDVGVGGSGTATGVTELDSIDKFPSVLEVVNGEGAFEEDSGNVNNGYPVLKMD